ncbi:MAG: protoporphyrinogen oxidase [Planctomycetia bacterium]
MSAAAESSQTTTTNLRVAVIGGGISGLAAAHRLLSRCETVDVTLFEASQRLGGIIRTEEADGFLMELGPDSFITNKPGGIQLCEEIGFTGQLITTDSRYRRSLVLSRGKPTPVPDGFMLMAPEKPWSLLKSPVLSLAGRLRLLSEYFVPPRGSSDDESLSQFVTRRFGREALDRLVQPLVGGIYTSDPDKLSLKATLPRFPEMEASHGSVIRATLAQMKARKNNPAGSAADDQGSGARYGLFTTAAGGLSDLVTAIESNLRKHSGFHFQPGTRVKSVVPVAEGRSGWLLTTERDTHAFDAVIITLPAYLAAGLLSHPDCAPLQAQLNTIEYASSAIVVSGHQLSDFSNPMDAFGLVVPAVERRKILAVSFSSRKFVNRAPDGHLVLRTFVGGAMQPELMQLDDDAILNLVNDELRDIFGMSREPLFSEVVRYHRAMPQYHVGHLDRVAAIEDSVGRWPGLHLAGSAYRGVGIPDSIASGREAADQILCIAGATAF